MKKEFLECGKILSAHGVRGCMKIEPWCDSPKVLVDTKRIFLKIGESYKECSVLSASVAARLVLMSFEGVESREAAQAMKNTVIYMKREDIPVKKGDVLIADMIDLPVIDIDSGRVYGTVKEVNDGVQGKLYTIKTASGDVIFPGISEFVKEIDAERGVFIRTIPGFFADDEI